MEKSKTLVALYDKFDDAQQAVRDLEAAGFSHDDISLVANDADQRYGSTIEHRDEGSKAGTGAGAGAVVGTVLGGGTGLLAGLGLLAIPGIGPVVAAGPLVATLVGAGVGAAAGGLVGALIGAGVPEEEAHGYAEGVRRGGALVTLRLAEQDVDRATAILERHNVVDIDERRAEWQRQGWTGFDESTRPPAESAVARERTRTEPAREGEQVIPVTEEQLQVGKRQVEGGRVRVRSYVTERPVQEQVALQEERARVERRPADRPAGADAFQERSVEVTERREEPVVSKTARVTEEVVVGKDADTRTETVSDTVRRTDVEVEDERNRTPGGQRPPR